MANDILVRVSGKDDLSGTLDKAEDRAGKFGGALKTVAATAAGFLSANVIQGGVEKFGAFLSGSVEQSTKLGESINAVNKIFGASSKEILDWGKNNATSFGLSNAAFNQLATPLGALLNNQGIKNVAGQTIELTKRAADLASVFNTDVETALAAINAGLKGEADPLEQFGVGLSAAKVEAQALADTGKKTTKELTDQEKAQARLNLIMKESASVAGDFTSTAGEYANAQRISAAKTEELQAKLGTKLIPVMQKVTQIKLALVTALVGFLIPAFEKVGAVVTMAARLLAAGFQTMDRTSDGWHGKMEQVGVVARRVFDWLRENVPPVLSAIGDIITNQVVPALQAMGSFLIDKVFPALQSVFGFLMEHKEILVGIAVAIGVGLVAAFVSWAVAAGAAAVATIAATLPIIAIGVAIAALVAGVIYAYQNWDVFRNAVDAVARFLRDTLWPALQDIAGYIRDPLIPTIADVIGKLVEIGTVIFEVAAKIAEVLFKIVSTFAEWNLKVIGFVTDVIGWFRDLPGKIGGFFGGLAETITAPFRAAFNAVADLWNNTVGKLSFEVPGWVPGLGGKGWDVPDIPRFAQGGVVRGRLGAPMLAIVHGGEEVLTPAERRQRMVRGGSDAAGVGTMIEIKSLTVTSMSEGEARKQAHYFMDELRRIEKGLS